MATCKFHRPFRFFLTISAIRLLSPATSVIGGFLHRQSRVHYWLYLCHTSCHTDTLRLIPAPQASIAAPGSSVQLSANISAICVFLDGFRLPGIHHWTPTASLSRYPCSGQPDILTISALGNYRTPRSTGVLYSSSWSQTWFKYSSIKLSFVSRPDVATTLILYISSLSPRWQESL